MTFYIFSLGCKVNSYECAAIASLLTKDGFIYDDKHPDVVIINTCSVTHVADQKSRQHIRKFRKLYPSSLIVAMGCYVQGNAETVKNECGADIIIGTNKRSEIPAKIREFMLKRQQIVDVDPLSRDFTYEELGVVSYSENIRAYLKIQDGCDNFCTYCIVPYRRGKSRSRDFLTIIKEAKELVEKGYQEIVLTGIHIGKYGKDINSSFSSLVEALCQIDGLYRLRISSLEESEIDDKLIHLLATNDKLAKHLHIPLQSGSDIILKRMARTYNTKEFLDKINKIKEQLPDICLTTDLIVGFPGETEADFDASYNFIKEVGFHQIHVFPYSPRTGSLAATFKDQIDPRIKTERVNKILELSNSLWNKYCTSFINKEVTIIVEKYNDKNDSYEGHSSNYLYLAIKDPNLRVGSIVKTTYK